MYLKGYNDAIDLLSAFQIVYTCPRTVQGLASGTRRRRINSASLTILSALKCFKYSTCFAGDVICERDDVVNGVDNPVPR